MISAPFGDLLKRHRLASGESQESLAERARMSAEAISALERGVRRAPYRQTVTTLSSALGLAPAQQAEFEVAAERARRRGSRSDEPAAGHNLPARLTSFIGRDDEMAELRTLLLAHRLVTVTGSGGVGKTRIAVEAARDLFNARFAEARFVNVAPVESGAFLAATIAAALDVPLPEVAEPLHALAQGLKTRRLVLILDNCEHIVDDAAAAAVTILSACPNVTILATSRERLAVEGERVYRLPSLPVPDGTPATIEEACTYASFRLFVERASLSGAHWVPTATSLRAGAEICRRLEGIPLALELAATRLAVLGLEALNDRLKGHFLTTSGTRDLPQRQQTMLATIAWSYDLLSSQEQNLLQRLAVFRGGSTLAAAAAVCDDRIVSAEDVPDLVAALVGKSLLFPMIGEPGRFVMLESVREFALGKLHEAGAFDSAARAHALWLATVADRAHELWLEISQEQWWAEFAPELDNVRAALEWCLNSDAEGDMLLAGRILGGLRTLWLRRSWHAECNAWCTAILQRLDVEQHPIVAARVMRAEFQSARGESKLEAGRRAIPVFEQIDDRRGLTLLYATMAVDFGRFEALNEADQFISKAFALARQEKLQGTYDYVILLEFRCRVHLRLGRLRAARADLTNAKRIRITIGERIDARIQLTLEGLVELAEGNVRRSVELFKASVAQGLQTSKALTESHVALCVAHLLLADMEAAESGVLEVMELSRNAPFDVMSAVLLRAMVLAVRGRPSEAARFFGFVKANGPWELRSQAVLPGVDILTRSLNEQLPPETLAELMAEGAELDADRALEEALAG